MKMGECIPGYKFEHGPRWDVLEEIDPDLVGILDRAIDYRLWLDFYMNVGLFWINGSKKGRAG